MAGIPIYMSNHVAQSAYTNVAGDKNPDYEQDLSKCKGLIFHRDAVGVDLLSPSLQMTGLSSAFSTKQTCSLPVRQSAWGSCVLSVQPASTSPDYIQVGPAVRRAREGQNAPFFCVPIRCDQ